MLTQRAGHQITQFICTGTQQLYRQPPSGTKIQPSGQPGFPKKRYIHSRQQAYENGFIGKNECVEVISSVVTRYSLIRYSFLIN